MDIQSHASFSFNNRIRQHFKSSLLIFALVAGLVCACFTSCTKKSENEKVAEQLIGSWKFSQGSDFYWQMTFKEGGKGVDKYVEYGNTETYKFTWSVENNGKTLVLEYDDDPGDEVELEIISITEKKLVLAEDDDEEYTFKRQ